MEAELTLPRLRVLSDPPGEPHHNMERDEQLAREVRAGKCPPTLRIYGWIRPAVSLGRRQPLDDLLKPGTGYTVPGTDLGALPVVRRPTGGGAVVHRLDEVTYALALPLPVPGTGYRTGTIRGLPGLIHRALMEILVSRRLCADELSVAPCNSAGPFTFCFRAPACGDLMLRGTKVGGAAMRAWRDGVLIQGSLQGLPVGNGPLAEALADAAGGAFTE